MIAKMKGGINMKIVLLTSVFAIILLTFGVLAVSQSSNVVGDVFGGTAGGSSEIPSITQDITEGDLVQATEKVDAVVAREHPSQAANARVVITRGQGWAISGSDKAAFVKFQTVTKQAVDGDQVLSKSQGKIIIGDIKADLESVEDSETRKVYSLKTGDGSVKGRLILQRQSDNVYNEGKFAVWDGELTMNALGTEFEAKVTLALEVHKIGAQKVKEYKDKVTSTYTGWFNFGDYEFKFQGTPKSHEKRIEASVYGSTGLQGRMVLEKESSGDYNYVGWLKVEEVGDSDDRLSANLKVRLESDGNYLKGPLRVEVADGSGTVIEGEMTVVEERRYSSSDVVVQPSTSVDGDVDERSVDSIEIESEDSFDDSESVESSNSESGSSNSGKKKGFWKKFFNFFGSE